MRLFKPHELPGTLICVEGIDGSGKSTQLAILRDWLKSKNLDVIFTEWNSSDLISQTTKKAKKKKHPLPLLLKACPLWGILYMLSATWSVQGSSDFSDVPSDG